MNRHRVVRVVVKIKDIGSGNAASIMTALFRNLLALIVTMLVVPSAYAAYIVVDTGHTVRHPGAMGANGRAEYAYNLDMTNALANDLISVGDRVLRVGADGREIKLEDRATRAPDADLFVSIHHDSMLQAWIDAGRNREFSGYSIFVSEKNRHYRKSLECARKIGERLQAAGERPSLYHATPVAGENRPLLDARLGIHRFDDLVVLKTAPIPAVLVEVGVIANPDEAVRLGEPQVVRGIARAISLGILDCQN